MRPTTGHVKRAHAILQKRDVESVQTELRIVLVVAALGLGASTQDTDTAKAVSLAMDELTRSMRIPRDALVVVDATTAEWRDSALGCPKRGMVYQAVMTSGHVVTLRSGIDRFVVHVGAGRAVICGSAARASATPAATSKLPVSDATVGLKRAEEARADLAKHLGVAADSIVIDFFKPTTWPDNRLGCPGTPPASRVEVRGFSIQLSARGKSYEYHSDATNPPTRCSILSRH
jgi:hypothetical protein